MSSSWEQYYNSRKKKEKEKEEIAPVNRSSTSTKATTTTSNNNSNSSFDEYYERKKAYEEELGTFGKYRTVEQTVQIPDTSKKKDKAEVKVAYNVENATTKNPTEKSGWKKVWDTILGVGGNLLMGAESAVSNTVDYMDTLMDYGMEKAAEASIKMILNKTPLEEEAKDKLVEKFAPMAGDKLYEGYNKYSNNYINKANKELNNEEMEEWRTKTIQSNIDKSEGTVGKYAAEIAPSIGQNLTNVGLSVLNPTLGTTMFMTSAAGSYLDDAEQRGMDQGSALAYATVMGGVEGLTEKFISGQAVSAGAEIVGAKAITKETIANVTKTYGFSIAENALQEAVTEPLSELTAQVTGGKEYADWDNIEQRMLKAGFDGAISGVILSGVTAGVGSSVRVYNKMKNGQEVTQAEITEAINDAREAGIDVDQIAVDNLKEASNIAMQEVTNTQPQDQTQGLEELNEITNAGQITDENELRKQNFTYQAQENDSNIRKAIYESASQVMNNTEKSHKFVDVVAKIAEEKGTTYKFTNNEQLQQLGYAKDNVTINGLVNENGEVLINVDSAKALNTVVGHETTHLLEGTKEYDALKQVAIEYAKSKGDYDTRIERLTKLYEGTNADIEAELTSDIVGEYLFTDEAFIQELSVKQPTVFEKIKNFISDLVVKFKGTEQEKQLRQLQRTFEKAYKAQGTQTNTDTKYSFAGVNAGGFRGKGLRGVYENVIQIQEAEKLEKQGKNAEEIYKQTGWYRGNEGKWRFEIDDSNFNIKPDVKLEKNSTYKLSDILEAPELYEAYPALEGVEIQFKDLDKGQGSFDLYSKIIQIDNNEISDTDSKSYEMLGLKNQNKLFGDLMHEIQHYIQDIEGFSIGSSPEYWYNKKREELFREATEKAKAILNEVESNRGQYVRGMAENMYNKLEKAMIDLAGLELQTEEAQSKIAWDNGYQTTDKMKSVLNEIIEDNIYNLKYFSNDNLVNEWIKTQNELLKYSNRDGRAAYELYENTAGEQEARNVQDRIKLSSEEKKNTMPFIKDENTVYAEKVERLYSLSTTDNQGRELTKEQQDFFKDSKVRDNKGNLITVYHGSNADFTVFDNNKIGTATGFPMYGEGFYFTDSKSEATDYSGNSAISKGKMYETYLDIKNPYMADAMKDAGALNKNELIKQGYDGVIINNGDSKNYVVFNSNQIKNVDNTKPTSNPDIRYSLSESGKMVDNKGNEVKLEASETGTHGTLMAMHNLSDSKLRGVLELGGFPVPSIAITNPKLDFTNYGEISVIFDKETINPTNKQNEVYGSDVYSPRFPDTVNELIDKGVKQVSDILGMSSSQFEANYEGMSKEEVANRLTRETSVIDRYLESKNITVEPVYKTYSAEQSRVPVKYIENFYNAHQELQNNDINIRELNYDDYSEEIKQIYIDSLVEQGVSIEDAQDLYKDFGKADITKFLIDIKNYKKFSSQGQQQIDTYATKQEKIKHIDFYSDEYRNFVEDLIAPAFGDKYIRNNKDVFTPSGNRRSFKQLHDPYNLENIVKNMKGKVRGEEGFFYGAGNIRSQVTPQFKSIAEIKANEGKLITNAQMEEVKQDINSDLNNLSVTARNFGGHSYDSYEAALNEIAELKKITSDKARNILNDYGFKNVPDILVKKSIEFLEKLKNAPTEYFEAKPQRAVGFDEVEAIVVPNNISAELKQQLYDNGLNVIEYDPNIEGDRQAKINELDEYKFSLSAQNEEIAPTGEWNVYGKDIKYQVEEAIAPLQEKIENLTEQLETVMNSNEQVQEVKPTKPTLEEVQNLMDIKENKSGSEYANAFFALRDKYGQANLYKSLNEYYAKGTVTEENNEFDLAPTSQEVVEKQNEEAFNTITDNDAPNFEDVVDEAMWSEDFETGENTGNKVQSPLEDRNIEDVGNRKIKAYQYENPEVRPYFMEEAQNMLYDLDNTIKGEKVAIHDQEGYISEWTGTTRQTTEAIAYLKDNYKYSYEQIRQGLNKIIEDDGAENNAVSKRIEFMLDERLREGYTTSDGYPIPPNQEYIKFLEEKQITEYNRAALESLAVDENVPVENNIAPELQEAPIEPKTLKTNESISLEEKMVQNGNTDVTEGKQRKWVETSTESEVVNREVLPDDLDQNKIFYQPITNKKTLDTVNIKLDTLGYEEAVKYFNGQILNKKTSVEDIALGERLIQEAVKKGDTKTAGDLIQDVAILGTELGQKVQALSIIQRMTPEGQLRMLEKTINRGKTKGDKAFTDVQLTQEMKDKVLKTYFKDGSYNQKALDKAVEEVKQDIADQMKVSVMDKVNSWRYFSMLGNPKTHIRNLVSNVAMKGTLAVKNAVARTIEEIAPVQNRTKTWKQASQEVENFAKQTTLEMKDIISGDNKYSETADIKAKRKVFETEFLNKLTDGNSNLLEKEDWWFSKGAFESSFKEFLTANGITTQEDIQNNPELIEKGKLYATEQAQIATFRQYSWLANKIRDIENKNAVTQIAVGSIVPFKKTPVNIAKTGLSYSPLGFAKTLTYDIAQVKKGNMEASTLIDHIAQNTTGTALTLTGYMLAQAGFLNGGGDDDKEGKYDYQLGKQAYSISIGDNTYSLSWLSPVAMPLFVGANAYEQLVEGKEWNGDVVLETLAQTLDPLSEMSFLSSLDTVLSSYDSGVQKFAGIAESMLQNYATQFIPTASSQIAATIDDTKRSTKVSGDSGMKIVDETYNKLIYKIPLLRQTLEPSTDIWGNEVKQSNNMLQRAFENFIAPYSRKESIATDIDNELKDLYSQTGDNGLLPSIPYNYVNYDGEKYNMSAKEYTDYKKTYGQTANDLLEDLFRTTTYKNASTEDRVDMVNDVYDYSRDKAKLEYLEKENVSYTNATEDGEAIYRENYIKKAIDNDMTVDEYKMYEEKPDKYNFLTSNNISYEEYESNKDLYNYAYENPEKYAVSKAITDDFATYYSYIDTMNDFNAKDENGESVSGLKKERIFNYINDLDLTIEQKAIMFKMQYPKDKDYVGNSYNAEIVQHVGNLDIDYSEKVKILENLGMTVKDDRVYWE